MTLNLAAERGIAPEAQSFSWADMVRTPISKLDDDAFTRCRILLMNAVEQQGNRLSHFLARTRGPWRAPLARLRRLKQHRQTLVHWLLPPDLSPLEITLSLEQLAIEVTSMVARAEPDPYLAQVHRFGMLEDFDHLYRFAALYDRVEGKDANNLLQCYTDICAGRPTRVHHRDPMDDLREPYEAASAAAQTKVNALLILAAENQVRDFYMTTGPMFADPVARQLYAEIASVEEQHVTQYECISDPNETLPEKVLLQEATEIYGYYCCLQTETNPKIKEIWERCLNYGLGHLHALADSFQQLEQRDAMAFLPSTLPTPLPFTSQRDFVRQVIAEESHLRAAGTQFIAESYEQTLAPDSIAYREQINRDGCPADIISEGYRWSAGTEVLSEYPNPVPVSSSRAAEVESHG